MFHHIAAIARHTIRETHHGRLPWIAIGLVLLCVLMAEFIGNTALTDAEQIKAGIVGFALRWLGALLLAVFVIASQVRESEDRIIELFFSLPIRREHYFLGKLLGYLALAAYLALLAGLAAALYAPPAVALAWALGHLLELALVAGFALLVAISIGNITAATCAVAGFYMLARGIGALQLMATGPFYDADSLADRFLAAAVDYVALIVPHFDRYAPVDWLVRGEVRAVTDIPLGGSLPQAAVYLLLLCAAGLVDLRRKQL